LVKSFNSSDIAGTVDLPTKAPAQTKKTKDKLPITDLSMWLESKINVKESVSEVFPTIKL
jgi:hypothetical protein